MNASKTQKIQNTIDSLKPDVLYNAHIGRTPIVILGKHYIQYLQELISVYGKDVK